MADPKFNYKSPFDFDLSKLTVEEAKKRLLEMGIPTDTWENNEEYVKDGDKAQLPTFKFYAEMLTSIRDICQTQVDRDLKEIDHLQVKLHRLRKGGGV
jgi:hypothetical protein